MQGMVPPAGMCSRRAFFVPGTSGAGLAGCDARLFRERKT
jgi:hypothetical protein